MNGYEEESAFCVECGTPVAAPVHHHFCSLSCYLIYKGEME